MLIVFILVLLLLGALTTTIKNNSLMGTISYASFLVGVVTIYSIAALFITLVLCALGLVK